MRISLVRIITAVILLGVPLPTLAVWLPEPAEIAPGRLVVRLRGGPVVVPGAVVEREIGGGIYLLHLMDESPQALAVAREALEADPRVEWVEPDYIRHAMSMDPDPLFKQQWALSMSWIPAAWDLMGDLSPVVVAVLDTGIQLHPDINASLLPGYDFISDDFNATDTHPGRDDEPADTGRIQSGAVPHGLHVAGIIGARRNDIGTVGVHWRCRILPVRVLGVHDARGRDSDIADGIRWAAGIHVKGIPDNPYPASVINLSFGGPMDPLRPPRLLQAAIDDATRQGAIVVAAAGNDSADVSGYAPAGLANVIAVGAVGPDGQLAEYSNFGGNLDLVAPGGDGGEGILSTWRLDDGTWTYDTLTGTSQAAPHVTGVVALMRALAPRLSFVQVRQILRSSAVPIPGCGLTCGAGLLDAFQTMRNAMMAAGCPVGCPSGTQCIGGVCGDPSFRGVVHHAGCSVVPVRGPCEHWPLVILLVVGLRGRCHRSASRMRLFCRIGPKSASISRTLPSR